MKVTYPHMGYLNIPVFNMLNNLGMEVIEAPPISQKTLELGSLYSPEGVCLPYKINMGNFLESIDQGADTLITICGAGKCRMGFFNAVQKISLAAKKKLQFFTINTENLFRDLYRFLRQTTGSGRLAVIKNIAMAVQTLKALDAINDAKNCYGARASAPEQIINICDSGVQQFAGCRNFSDISYTRDMVIDLMKNVTNSMESRPAKVALLGEFYVLMEPYVNHMIENLLIKQGIEVKKFVSTGEWVYSKAFLQSLGLYNEEKDCLNQARPYLNYHVGGDGLKSVGSALWSAQNGYDGIIHVYPFGCMPEVVAQYALKNIASDYNLPLLSLSLDEHSSDVGIITRVEAFADCIKRKQHCKEKTLRSLR
ncbi:hypothetical protein SCACP_07560 [Sporomusa carbonis]|uniref:hypothetical protein n=1 Tax=Sporomusa carbonis TaxID=3076075 RepID=UPI003A65620A